MRIAIAEDYRALRSYLERCLRSDSNEVESVGDGEAAFAMVLAGRPDLLLLDLDLPLRSGLDVLREVRERSCDCMVLVLSGQADTQMRTQCLALGADDCLPKPFSVAELRARCEALLRRARRLQAGAGRSSSPEPGHALGSVLAAGELLLDRFTRTAHAHGQRVALTAREFALLEQLLLAGEAELSRRTLLATIWGAETIPTNALDVHIGSLRRKLAAAEAGIEIGTIRGSGYQMRATLTGRPDLAWREPRPAAAESRYPA